MEHLGIEYFRILTQYELEVPYHQNFKMWNYFKDEVDILPQLHRNDW